VESTGVRIDPRRADRPPVASQRSCRPHRDDEVPEGNGACRRRRVRPSCGPPAIPSPARELGRLDLDVPAPPWRRC
jgi:hypothetical protein